MYAVASVLFRYPAKTFHKEKQLKPFMVIVQLQEVDPRFPLEPHSQWLPFDTGSVHTRQKDRTTARQLDSSTDLDRPRHEV
jgi:hypothetical protein